MCTLWYALVKMNTWRLCCIMILLLFSTPPLMFVERTQRLCLQSVPPCVQQRDTFGGVQDRHRGVQLSACEEVCCVMLLYVAKGTEWWCVVWSVDLYSYDVRKGDLFVLSCARMRRCALVSVASVVFIVGAAVCSIVCYFFLLLR